MQVSGFLERFRDLLLRPFTMAVLVDQHRVVCFILLLPGTTKIFMSQCRHTARRALVDMVRTIAVVRSRITDRINIHRKAQRV